MDWVALDFPSIDATPGLRFINSHLEKNFAEISYTNLPLIASFFC